MLNPALSMTYAQKQERAANKRRLLLDFLASGESYTSPAIVAELLQTTERTARRFLNSLSEEKILRADLKAVPFSNLKIYGLTAHGIGITANAHPKCREFFTGSLNPNYLAHHLTGQQIRIKLERAGWSNWVPGKLLYVDNALRLKKLPDALATRPDGQRCAIEVERFCKSQKRMALIIAEHLKQILASHYAVVYYFSPTPDTLKRLFQSIEFVILDGEKKRLSEANRTRFKILDTKNLAL